MPSIKHVKCNVDTGRFTFTANTDGSFDDLATMLAMTLRNISLAYQDLIHTRSIYEVLPVELKWNGSKWTEE